MMVTRPPVNHEDERGIIRDLLVEPVDSITRITTKLGAVRGNHVHRLTHQWTYVLSGMLLMADGSDVFNLGPGELCYHAPGNPHAWRAITDTEVIVFTRGPRSGDDYESDTIRLDEPLLLEVEHG